jgi:TPR repeat protein
LRDSKPNETEFRQALALALEGDVDARRKVGILYYRGFGVRPNPPQAMKWLTLAAEKGDAKADEFLGLMQQAMTPEEIAAGQRLLARFKGQPEPDFSGEEQTFESPEESEEQNLHDEPGERWIPNDEFPDERELLNNTGVAVRSGVADTASPALRASVRPGPAVVSEPAPARVPAQVQVIVWVSVALLAMVAVGAGVVWLVNHPIEEVTIETEKSAAPAVTMTMPMPRPPEPPADTSSAPAAQASAPTPNPAQPAAPGVSELQRLFNEANAGSRQAQFLAGLALAEGKLMPANLPEAFKWFAVAAERGHPDAQNNLAIFYIRGMGVSKDLATAYKWLALARAGGNRDAAANEERLRKMLQPEELARAQQEVAGFIPKP